MRSGITKAAYGLIAAALLAGCDDPDPANPVPLTRDEEAAAKREIESIENAEMRQTQKLRASRQSR